MELETNICHLPKALPLPLPVACLIRGCLLNPYSTTKNLDKLGIPNIFFLKELRLLFIKNIIGIWVYLIFGYFYELKYMRFLTIFRVKY